MLTNCRARRCPLSVSRAVTVAATWAVDARGTPVPISVDLDAIFSAADDALQQVFARLRTDLEFRLAIFFLQRKRVETFALETRAMESSNVYIHDGVYVGSSEHAPSSNSETRR